MSAPGMSAASASRQQTAGLLATLFSVVLWGIQLPIGKDVFAVIDAVHVTLLRYALGTLLLLIMLLILEGPVALRYNGRAMPAAVIGTIGMCASPLLVFFGMALSRAEHTVVIVTLQPLITVVAQWLLQGRRPAPFTLLCIGAAFAGVVLVVTRGHLDMAESGRALAGDLLSLAGAGCWVAYTMNIHRLAGWSALRVTTLTLIPGTIATGIASILLVKLGLSVVPDWHAMESVAWQLTYLVLGGVYFSMLAWIYGAQRIGPLNAALLINVMPVTTFAVRALQGQAVLAIELAGATLVVLSLAANNIYLRRQSQRFGRA